MAATKETATKAKAHPTFLEMAKEAIVDLADSKGTSVQGIQSFIAGKYPIEPDVIRQHLKPALAKGLLAETFVRPKGSDAKGYTGRFKINKVKLAEETKEKAKKAKKAEKKEETATKATKKTAASTKSPKKTKTTGDKAKVKKPAVKKTPTKKAAKPVAKTAKTPKGKPSLKTPKKVPKKTKSAK